MQNNREAIAAEAAGEWLRGHFKGDPAPRIDITFRNEELDPVAYHRILEILFRPRIGTSAT
ncbi:hypothetical protein [Streptomyces sp. NBC_01217]|uniref:hypothetical protein n=1 Tax=Streptomyces sp. NBC_01217 TaxID=2903779 RepID=UPI002E0F60D2|nr:hypothetical protein OG507_34715 [Streptomyces sp. NBC_01217]